MPTDVVENVGTQVNELTDSLRALSDPMAPGRKELSLNITGRIHALTDILDDVVKDSPKKESQRRKTIKP